MNKKTDLKSHKKDGITLKILKILLAVLTIIYPLTMNILSGLGMFIRYNGSDFAVNWEKYSSQLSFWGLAMVFGGLFMTVGTILCITRKNILSVIFSAAGFTLSGAGLLKIASHADFAGWSDKYSLAPISDMYLSRNLPIIAPFILCTAISLFQHFSQKKI